MINVNSADALDLTAEQTEPTKQTHSWLQQAWQFFCCCNRNKKTNTISTEITQDKAETFFKECYLEAKKLCSTSESLCQKANIMLFDVTTHSPQNIVQMFENISLIQKKIISLINFLDTLQQTPIRALLAASGVKNTLTTSYTNLTAIFSQLKCIHPHIMLDNGMTTELSQACSHDNLTNTETSSTDSAVYPYP